MTKNSPVPSINNLAMWLETTGENSFINSSGSKNISDGDPIQTWVDSNPQSISKILVTQTATDRRPIFVENVINGIPVVRFSEDFFTTTLANSGSADMTVFIVARNSDSGVGGQGLIFAAATGGRHYFHVLDVGYRATFGNSSLAIIDSSISTSDQRFRLLETVSGGVSPSASFYIDGNLIGTSSYDGMASGLFFIGTLSGSTNVAHLFTGDIGEIIVYDRRLNTEERTSVEGYLKKKCGIL